MKNKYVFTAVLLAMILFVGSVLTMAYVRAEQKKEQAKDEDLLVVTSFYPMYVAAENVIGDVEGVTLENLSEPQTGYRKWRWHRELFVRCGRVLSGSEDCSGL